MATNFPGSLDSFTNPSSSSTLDSPSHAAQHANINDAVEAVQTKLGVGAGTIGEWTSFTPVFSSLTLGDGTVDAKYCQVNNIVFVNGKITLGSTSSVTGWIWASHPIATTATPADVFNGVSRFTDANTNQTFLGVVQISSTYARFGPSTVPALNAGVRYTSSSSTFPFTWATSDALYWSYWYQKA